MPDGTITPGGLDAGAPKPPGLPNVDTTPTTEAKPDRISPRRAGEITSVASVLFNRDRQSSPELATAHHFQNLDANGVAAVNTDINDNGSQVRLMIDDPDFGIIEVQVREVVDASKKGELTFSYSEIDPDTGKPHSDTIQSPITLSREEFIDGFLVAEKENILASYNTHPDEKVIVEAHLSLIDQRVHPDDQPGDTATLREQLEKVATDKLLTVADMRSYITGILSQNLCTGEQGQEMLDMISKDGQVVVTPDAITAFLKIGRLDAAGLSQKIQKLGQEKALLEQQLANQTPGSSEWRDTKKQIDEAQAAGVLCEQTQKLLETPDDQGRDPITAFFGDTAAGKVDLSKMGDIIQAFRDGNVDKLTESILAGIPMPEGLTDEERKEFKANLLKKVVIGGGIAVGAPLGLLAILAMAIGTIGGVVIKGATGQER